MAVSGKCLVQPRTPGSQEVGLEPNLCSSTGHMASSLELGGHPHRAGTQSNSPSLCLHYQVTRPCSYSRKSHFDFEEEDVDKLEIR